MHIDKELRSLDDLEQLIVDLPDIARKTTLADIIAKIARNGAFDPFAGYLPADTIEIKGTNYRETIVARGANSRGRGVLYALADFVSERGTDVDVYACECISPFAQRLQNIFGSRFIGSEFLPTAKERGVHPSVRHEDVQALSFANRSFDLYINCEVLEHIPNIDQALAEAHRVLRPGALFLGTVPFAYRSKTGVVRARLSDGVIKHLMEPEYHGNPVDTKGGSLVFEIPGWNILERLRSAGFKDAAMRLIGSSRFATFGAEIAGIFVFEARA